MNRALRSILGLAACCVLAVPVAIAVCWFPMLFARGYFRGHLTLDSLLHALGWMALYVVLTFKVFGVVPVDEETDATLRPWIAVTAVVLFVLAQAVRARRNRASPPAA